MHIVEVWVSCKISYCWYVLLRFFSSAGGWCRGSLACDGAIVLHVRHWIRRLDMSADMPGQ